MTDPQPTIGERVNGVYAPEGKRGDINLIMFLRKNFLNDQTEKPLTDLSAMLYHTSLHVGDVYVEPGFEVEETPSGFKYSRVILNVRNEIAAIISVTGSARPTMPVEGAPMGRKR